MSRVDFFRLQKTMLHDVHSDEVEREALKADIQVYQEIRPFLPDFADKILDIGCGMGGISALLYRHYGDPDIYLLDKNGKSDAIYYGHNPKAAHYCDMNEAKRYLMENGVPEDRIHLCDMLTQDFPKKQFDVIISIIAWGFHFPISTYLNQVKEVLGDTLIIDVRHGTNGEQELSSLGKVSMIREHLKHNRFAVKIAESRTELHGAKGTFDCFNPIG